MPIEKANKKLCVEDLRHAEYYGMQKTFDTLYARSQTGEIFEDLMGTILSRENILLAYRNIKANTGSRTPGTDNLSIEDIGYLTPEAVVEKVRFIVLGSRHGYRPKAVRRKDIPKPNGSTRPLGIPCIWDRLVQQCIKQVMEPICESKFSNNSYGFRPGRSVEYAIASTYRLMQRSKLHYIVEFDIKGFFDNVDHSKLIKQIWALGIHDKRLIYVLKQVLKAPIKMPDGTTVRPTKGTPQGGIISPLLANIVLNELDHWVESQWQNNPVVYKYKVGINKNGTEIKSSGFNAMRSTGLKELYIIRYADDFRIFCRTKTDAENARIAITKWLAERLRLEVSPEKTRTVNVKRRYTEFLGFKIKVQQKGEKQAVKSHISDKQLQRKKAVLIEQVRRIANPPTGSTETVETKRYNTMVLGMQNYYRIATQICKDCSTLNRSVMTVLTNRLSTQIGSRMAKKGRELTETERKLYGKTKMMRYLTESGEPIYPIGSVYPKLPMSRTRSICFYTANGRAELHDNLQINTKLLLRLMRQPLQSWQSTEYADNRISLFSAQWGKCAVTGKEFECLEDIHCHHRKPRKQGGSDGYKNLILVLEPIHRLIHSTEEDTIRAILETLSLDTVQIRKLNALRNAAYLKSIA